MADISSEDYTRHVQPAILAYNAKVRAVLLTHFGLVRSLYDTGLTKASRDGALGDLSAINPISDPDTQPEPEASAKEAEAAAHAARMAAAFSPSKGLAPTFMSAAEIEPPPRATDDTPTSRPDPTIKGVTNSINSEVNKSLNGLHEQFIRLGKSLVTAIWDSAAVPMSSSHTSTVAKVDPEVMAALG